MPVSDEKRVEIFLSIIEEGGRMLRLVLGLSAGAVILFVNLLANLVSPRWIALLLVASALFFGMTILWCLRVLLALLNLRAIMIQGIQDQSEDWFAKAQNAINAVNQRATSNVRTLQYLFLAGVFFAAAFVTAISLTR